MNVCIFRIPEKKSIVYPPSSCGNCGHKLNFIDMLPVINYIVYAGKCRYCKEKYSLQYPVIELINGILYVLIYKIFGFSFYTFFYCVTSSILLVITMIDYKHMIIPNELVIFYLAVTVVYILVFHNHLLNNLLGGIIGFLLFLLIAILTNAMGGGDIKLIGAIGLMFGIKGIIFIIFFSFILGALISLILLITKIKSRKDMIPFGPFISISTLLYILFGTQIINFYWSLF